MYAYAQEDMEASDEVWQLREDLRGYRQEKDKAKMDRDQRPNTSDSQPLLDL